MKEDIKICVGGVVIRCHKVLFVRQTYGIDLKNKWTIPWGYAFNPDIGIIENPDEAVVREIKEEAGIEAKVDSLIGVQNYMTQQKERQLHFLYLCQYVSGEPKPDFKETSEARFFSLGELKGIYDECDKYCFWLAERVLSNKYNCLKISRENPYAYGEIGFY